jgi:hypothetical protein
VDSEARFLDEGIRPYASEKFLLTQQLTRLLHQRDEDVPCAAAEPNGRVAFEELALTDKKTEGAKGDNVVRCFAERF